MAENVSIASPRRSAQGEKELEKERAKSKTVSSLALMAN